MMRAMRKVGVFSILFVTVPLAVAVIAEAQQQAKLPKMGGSTVVLAFEAPGWESYSCAGSVNSDMLRARTSLSSIDPLMIS